MRYSTIILTPAPQLDMANFLMESQFNAGPDAISRALYDSDGDITYYGAAANTEDDWQAIMPSVLDGVDWSVYGFTLEQITALLSPPFVTSQPMQTENQRDHFERQCGLIGVSLYPPEETEGYV